MNYKLAIKAALHKFNLYVYRQPMNYPESRDKLIQNVLLQQERGVLHLGGHEGQEIEKYSQFGLKVIWVEANPEIFDILENKLTGQLNQSAYCNLLSDVDNEIVNFYISNGDAGSSSMFEFGSQLEFEDLRMVSEIKLKTTRLDSMFNAQELSDFGHWVVDVQGAELQVLSGASNLLGNCRSMYIEVSTREVYKGGTSYAALKEFLRNYNLHPLWEPQENSHENLIFFRIDSTSSTQIL
jgi:FkbM family methyltransferase